MRLPCWLFLFWAFWEPTKHNKPEVGLDGCLREYRSHLGSHEGSDMHYGSRAVLHNVPQVMPTTCPFHINDRDLDGRDLRRECKSCDNLSPLAHLLTVLVKKKGTTYLGMYNTVTNSHPVLTVSISSQIATCKIPFPSPAHNRFKKKKKSHNS